MTGIRAVVVDDNRLNREIVARTLESNGVKAVQAEDAAIGWKVIQTVSPHLVVLDIMLPGTMDGVGLCRLLRSDPRYQDTVIVMVTASDKRREADRSLAAGADILMPKPFSPKEFWFQVDSLLKKKVPAGPAPLKIFVLDDDEKELLLAEKSLTTAGFLVMTANQAVGAIAAMKTYQPDLILLDLMMPDLSGDVLARILSREKSFAFKPKILFFSNKSAAELQALVEKTGVDGYICKTDGPRALLKTVFQALENVPKGQ